MSKENGTSNLNLGFFEEQLYEAQQNLFFARNVKQAKFLSQRINFLREQIKELNGKKKRG